MNLNKENLSAIRAVGNLQLPSPEILSLPEKVLQFGTGVLLRALPDYYIDKANKQGIFDGRIVVVKSTSRGGSDAFDQQDGLFTHSLRGYDQGEVVDRFVLNASISRVLEAGNAWNDILDCAENPDLEVVISNTTEAGIVLIDDDIHAAPPESFPGKLLAVLYRRFNHFKGDINKGLVILPTELITNNGTILKEYLLALSAQNNLGEDFTNWLIAANDFCNTLVDRIVPGKLSAADQADAEKTLGYSDELMIMSEIYGLWAIETNNQRAIAKLSFAKVDTGVVVTNDITRFKELKLRLLNGSHTFTCGLAVEMGFELVKQAMADEEFYSFISSLMYEELVPAIVSAKVSEEEAKNFAGRVLDRYRNPFIEHKWLSITLQYTMKMKLRNVETIFLYYEKFGKAPQKMAKGFAAYLRFMQGVVEANGEVKGHINNLTYTINDQHAAPLSSQWQEFEGIELVRKVLADQTLWERSLLSLPGFDEAVYEELIALRELSPEAQ